MSNLGNDTVHVTGISFYNGAQGFKRTTPATANILQKELFDVTLEFTAPGSGSFVDTMLIVTDDTTGGNDSIVVPLSATGFVPGVSPLATSFEFDTTTVGVYALDSIGFAGSSGLSGD